MYITTKMPKRVKMLTYSTDSKKTSPNILLDHFNAFGYSRNIFSVANNGEGGILDYAPSGAPWQFDLTKLAHCTSRLCILQNSTTIRPLRHILRKKIVGQSPPVVPQGGLDWTKIAHAQLHHWVNNIRP